MEALRPNAERAKKAILLIWIVFSLEILSFFVNLVSFLAFEEKQSKDIIQLTNGTILKAVVDLFFTISFSIFIIFFVKWFRRAYFNLHQLKDNLLYSHRWASVSWFIPLFNLFVPLKILKEIFKKTHNLLNENKTIVVKLVQPKFLNLWWVLLILSNFLGLAEFYLFYNSSNQNMVKFSYIVGIIGNLIGFPLTIITIRIIKDYSKAENSLYEVNYTDEEINSIGSKLNQ